MEVAVEAVVTAPPVPTIREGSSVDDTAEGEEEGGIEGLVGCTTVARGGGLALKALACIGISECTEPPREEKEVDLHDSVDVGA